MDNLMWQLKQWFRKLLPIAIIGAVIYGGYSMFQQGTFRRGVGPGITQMLNKLPYFGSRFKHYSGSSVASYGKGRSYSKKHKARRGGRRARRHR